MIDFAHVEQLVATASDGYDIGIWRNDAVGEGVAWSWNQIDDCVDILTDDCCDDYYPDEDALDSKVDYPS